MTEATPRPLAIRARDFRDIMAVMMSIDLDELERAGVIAQGNIDNGGNSWKRFNDAPLLFVLKLNEAKLEALTALVNQRRCAVNNYDEALALLRDQLGVFAGLSSTLTVADLDALSAACVRIDAFLAKENSNG